VPVLRLPRLCCGTARAIEPILHFRKFEQSLSHLEQTFAFVTARMRILGLGSALHCPAS
jgi:hypothetical protein